MTATVGKDFHGSRFALLGEAPDSDVLHHGDGVAIVSDLCRDFSADRDAFAEDSVAAFVAAFVTSFFVAEAGSCRMAFASLGMAAANRCKMVSNSAFGTRSAPCLAVVAPVLRRLVRRLPTPLTHRGLVSRLVLGRLAPSLVTRFRLPVIFLALLVT